MNLFVHLFSHLFLSLIVGYFVWRLWRKPVLSFLAAIIGGVLVDLDHLIDYYWAFGIKFQLGYFLSGYQFLKSDKIYVLFHGWEYVIVLVVVAFLFKNTIAKTILLSLALGLMLHLWLDVFTNGIPAKSYFVVYRAVNNFEMKPLVKQSHYEEHLFKKQGSVIE